MALRPGGAAEGVAGGRAAQAIVGAIRIYQREISARRSGCCRMTPTCSEYGAQAVHLHGARRGLGLTVRRLLRCRPGGRRGSDPVPKLPR
ncbi:MAG: membrane protein insertion efficiency factor YidD [Actinomycetota bacterium]|nr:membrane protein insertion efficiency factor YidD [Actinomycetota bacterium]